MLWGGERELTKVGYFSTYRTITSLLEFTDIVHTGGQVRNVTLLWTGFNGDQVTLKIKLSQIWWTVHMVTNANDQP